MADSESPTGRDTQISPEPKPPSVSGKAAARREPSDANGKPATDRRLLASGLLGVLWSSLPAIAGIYILVDLEDIAGFLRQDPTHGFWAYVAVFAITAGLGLLPTYSQAFLGGWVFGTQWGLVGAVMGFTGGAAIGYLLARVVTGDSVDRWIDRHPRGRVIRDSLARGSKLRTFLIVTLLRLPNSPFAMTNYALSATRVPFWIVMLATPIGMTPRTAIVCFLAASAVSDGAENIKQAIKENPPWAVFVAIVSTVAAIAIMGHLANRALSTLTGEDRRPN